MISISAWKENQDVFAADIAAGDMVAITEKTIVLKMTMISM